MKPTPNGWPRLSAAIFYDDAAGTIDWLCRAFGFDVRLKVEGDGGRIEHSELVYGEAQDQILAEQERNFALLTLVAGSCWTAITALFFFVLRGRYDPMEVWREDEAKLELGPESPED